jgi:predicted ribosome quality control (RQC) complex YloA/Tae2 family protein
MFSRKSSRNQTKTFRAVMLSAFVFVMCAHVSVFAKSLTDYQESVQIALYSVDELSIYFANDEENAGEKDDAYERELIALVRENLPASEKIEWQGTSVETNNQWIVDKINAFETEEDPAKRAEILNIVSERLAAILEKISELEKPSISNRTKDEEKQKLAEILSREDYRKPEEQSESILQRWWREFTEWLQSVFPTPDLPASPPSKSQPFSVVLQIALYALVIGSIGFLLYKFAPLFISRYGKKEKSEKKDRVILGERIAANESAENLFLEAENLARQGNPRAAIRKGYIAILCDLSDKKIISLAQNKTNRDYLRDVRKRGEIYEKVSGLTTRFERHWYGLEPADEKDWNEFRQEYKKVFS